MKNYMLEKGLLFIGITGSLFTLPIDTAKKSNKDPASTPIIQTAGISSADTSTVESSKIIEEAKATMAEYNKSVEEKNNKAKRLAFLTRKELENAKKQSELILKITREFKEKKQNIKASDHVTVSEIKYDSVCTKLRKPIIGKDKCVNYTLFYYVEVNNKRIEVFNIKK